MNMFSSQDVQIQIGDRVFTLKYSIKAFAALQDHYGLSSLDAVQVRLGDTRQVGIMDLVVLIWAGTRSYHPDVTVSDIETLLDQQGIEQAVAIASKAFNSSFPEKDEDEVRDEANPR